VSPSPLLTPEEIGNNLAYSVDVHEQQLRELRADPAELDRLRKASVGTPIGGYTKMPLDLDERDRFFAAMMAICKSKPQTEMQYEIFSLPSPSRLLVSFYQRSE
jgi:hypothetical protein